MTCYWLCFVVLLAGAALGSICVVTKMPAAQLCRFPSKASRSVSMPRCPTASVCRWCKRQMTILVRVRLPSCWCQQQPEGSFCYSRGLLPRLPSAVDACFAWSSVQCIHFRQEAHQTVMSNLPHCLIESLRCRRAVHTGRNRLPQVDGRAVSADGRTSVGVSQPAAGPARGGCSPTGQQRGR